MRKQVKYSFLPFRKNTSLEPKMLTSVKNLNSISKFILIKNFILPWSIYFTGFNSLANLGREMSRSHIWLSFITTEITNSPIKNKVKNFKKKKLRAFIKIAPPRKNRSSVNSGHKLIQLTNYIIISKNLRREN